MLMPKRVKYRKVFPRPHDGQGPPRQLRSLTAIIGLVALEPCWITSKQIEAARVAITRYIKRGGQVWIKIFPDKPVTDKPAETRMGSGKGSPEYWVAVVKPGRVMFEMGGDRRERRPRSAAPGRTKLPLQDKVCTKEQSSKRVVKAMKASEFRP